VDVGQTDEANSDDDFLKPEVTFKQKETAFTGTSGDRPEMKFGNESVVDLSEVNRFAANGCQCYKLLFFVVVGDSGAKYARMFVIKKLFQVSLIFVGKAGSQYYEKFWSKFTLLVNLTVSCLEPFFLIL